ncbi:MAG: gamma-glutamylcyclotransferase [Proteobacteria bacterium]|nr:gamma-glutamylcyclotransferase [Pseudomonadota bacterium]
MTLCRRDLEENRMRTLYAQASGHAPLTDEQMAASLMATLSARPKGAGWWVFGYGSLLWNPIFPVAETRPARVRGLHRRFCLYSLASRGTAEQPGLVLGLERGGSVRGLAFRLPAPLAVDELHLLWRREMVMGGYEPRWVTTEFGGGKMGHAITFVVRRDHPQYAGNLSLDEQVRVLSCACGAFGSSREYLNAARAALAGHGVVDDYLETLASRLTPLAAAGLAPASASAEPSAA